MHQFGGRVGGPIVSARQGVLLLQLRAVPPAERGDARRARSSTPRRSRACSATTSPARSVRASTCLDARGAQRPARRRSIRRSCSLLNVDPRARRGTTGTISSRRRTSTPRRTSIQPPSERNEYAPTTRVDFNLTTKHRLTATYLWQRIKIAPDFLNSGEPAFPGFPNFSCAVVVPHDRIGGAALDAVVEHGQRVQDRLPVVAGGLLQRADARHVRPTRAATRVTLGLRPDEPDDRQRAEPAQHAEHQRREHADLAARQAQPVVRRLVHAHHELRRVVEPGADGRRSASATPTIRRNGMFTTANFPGASTANLTNARALYALLTGRVHLDQRHVASGRGDGRVRRTSATSSSGYAQKQFGVYVAGSVAHDADADAELRPALGSAVPFSRPRRPTRRRRCADLCGISGIGSGPEGRQCNLFKPGTLSARRVHAALHAARRRRAGLQHRVDQRRAERRRRVAAERADGWLAHAARRSGAGDGARRLLGELQPRAHGSLHRHLRQQPGRHDRPRTATSATATSCYPGETWPILLRETARLGPPATCPDGVVTAACVPRTPVYPIRATVANSLNIFDPDLSLPYTRSWSIGFQRALTRDSAIEMPLSRQPQRQRVDDGELERAEHGRERLPRRVRARAGEPAGQPGRRPRQHVRATSGRAPARRRCRSTSRTSAACRRRRHDPARYTSPLLRQHDVDAAPRPVRSGTRGRGQRPRQRRDAARSRRSTPASRRTSS